jgi:hypothetical protein
MWIRIGPVPRSLEHGNETLGSTEFWENLNELSDNQFIQKDSAPWRWLYADMKLFLLFMYFSPIIFSKLLLTIENRPVRL